MVRMAIVEDNPNSALLLKESAEAEGFEVCGVFGTGEAFLEYLGTGLLPEVLLLDLGLPGIPGIDVARTLKASHPRIEIIIQTVFEDPESILGAIRAGASGYLLKDQACRDLRRAVEEVMAGGSSLSPRVAKRVLEEFQHGATAPVQEQGDFGLTGREREILGELVKGSPCKHIADDLGISLHTVHNHLRKVYEKMRVDSRAEAVAVFLGKQGNR